MAIYLDGKAASNRIKEELAHVSQVLCNKRINPGLAVVMVGNHAASNLYVNMKVKACQQLGIYSWLIRLPETTTKEEFIATITQLNDDEDIDGILLQLPLPDQLKEWDIMEAVRPDKDVDCFHPYNQGLLFSGRKGLKPCTPLGCIALLEMNGIRFEGKKVVIVGRSNIVGKPLAVMLLQRNATVTICHSRTVNLNAEISQADLLVAALGKPQAISGKDLRPGCIVVDVGQHRLPDGKIVGDVDYESAAATASWITPVPGGTGPMTVAMLMYNTLWAAANRRGLPLDTTFKL